MSLSQRRSTPVRASSTLWKRPAFVMRPRIEGTSGSVASTHWLATQVGLRVLQERGNAFDAAVAMGFALQICEPDYNGFGGELALLLHRGLDGKTQALSGLGVCPQNAKPELYQSLPDGSIPSVGLGAAVAPGAFDGWMLLLRDFGSWSLRQVLEPAISLAVNGIVVNKRFAAKTRERRELFKQKWPSSAKLYLTSDGLPRKQGSVFKNPELASTLRRIIEHSEARSSDRETQIEAARDFVYRGQIAEEISNFITFYRENLSDDTEHDAIILDAEDLSNLCANFEDPVSRKVKNWRIFKCGTWTQGPVFIQHLQMLDALNINSLSEIDISLVHKVIETAKLAYADRDAFYGDPRYQTVPLDKLLCPDYATRRVKAIGDEASLEIRPGLNREHVLPHVLADDLPGSVPASGTDTCHFDVIDRDRNAVSATPSGGWFMDSPTIPGLGFTLSTRLQQFTLTKGSANYLCPGKRPRITLSPSIATNDDEGVMVAFGAPGADYQDQFALSFFLRMNRLIDHLQVAIDAPVFYTSHLQASYPPFGCKHGVGAIENQIGKDVIDGLRDRGHKLRILPDWWPDPRVTAVASADGLLTAGASARGGLCLALGW